MELHLDEAGNMLSRSNAQQTDTYQYDAQNRLVRVSRQGTVNTVIRYAYDYDGLLAERRDGADVLCVTSGTAVALTHRSWKSAAATTH